MSSCSISFFKNDLQKTKLPDRCPVKGCLSKNLYKIGFQKYQVPYCPDHGIRIHKSGFVYYNGRLGNDLITATKRNLPFNADYYIENFFRKGNKMESGRLCFESSEDAVSYCVFTALLSDSRALKQLVGHIAKEEVHDEVDLLLWGNKIDLKNKRALTYEPLNEVRNRLEGDILRFKTEPDIMLLVPRKIVICIEAKFGSKNPVAIDRPETSGEKPKQLNRLIERYYEKNDLLKSDSIFDFTRVSQSSFYEQLFRNIVFAASMAKIEKAEKWFVVNLRSQHLMNMKRGEPESAPVMRATRSLLRPPYKSRFAHITWEEIHEWLVKDNPALHDLSWYMKNKSLRCGRAFNVF